MILRIVFFVTTWNCKFVNAALALKRFTTPALDRSLFHKGQIVPRHFPIVEAFFQISSKVPHLKQHLQPHFYEWYSCCRSYIEHSQRILKNRDTGRYSMCIKY